MSKTNEIREYIRTLDDCERIGREHLAWIAAKFGVSGGLCSARSSRRRYPYRQRRISFVAKAGAAMSLVDEVLAEHVRCHEACKHPLPECWICAMPWPCESVRLALSLRAADIAIENLKLHMPGICWACNEALAEYDKGGQG